MRIKLKKKQNKYAQVHVNLLRNKNLSLRAKGLGAVLESYSDDFNLSLKSIELNSRDGKKSIQSAIKELEKGYYLFRFQTHDDVGKFVTYWAFDSQKLDVVYLKKLIKELEKVELITSINLNSPGYLKGDAVNLTTASPFTGGGKTADGESTIYNNTTDKNKKDKNTLSSKTKKRESFDFKKFKDYVSGFNNFDFDLKQKLDYSQNHKGFCIKNSYIFSYQTQKFIEAEEAFKIWEHLYKNKSKVFTAIDNFIIQNEKEEIKNAS